MLYTLAAMHGIEAVGLMAISDLIGDDGTSERISDDDLKDGVDRMMTVACAAAIS